MPLLELSDDSRLLDGRTRCSASFRIDGGDTSPHRLVMRIIRRHHSPCSFTLFYFLICFLNYLSFPIVLSPPQFHSRTSSPLSPMAKPRPAKRILDSYTIKGSNKVVKRKLTPLLIRKPNNFRPFFLIFLNKNPIFDKFLYRFLGIHVRIFRAISKKNIEF